MKASNDSISIPFISALFSEKQCAETAYSFLISKGYISEEINVAMSSTTKDKLYSIPPKPDATDVKTPYNGTLEGSTMGGIMGGIAFAIGAFGSNLGIRGLNLVLMGPIASALVGSSLGAIAGGLIGHILSPDKPDQESELFSEGIKNGKTLLAITPHNQEDADRIYAEWSEMGGEIVK